MKSRTWYLVRHGETEWNAASRMQGQWDSPLTPLGREQAKSSARLLARLGVDSAYASPLGRVRETIAIMEKEQPLLVTYDDRLKEWSAGQWSGELYAEIGQKWPAEWAAWQADRYTYRSPGGENFSDLADRARSFVAEIDPAPGAQVAVVAHGFLNRALSAVLLSLTPDAALRIHQSNDTIIRVVENGHTPTVDHFVSGDGPRSGLPEEESRLKETI